MLNLCLKKTPSGISREYHDVIVSKIKMFSVHTKTKIQRFQISMV